MSRILGHFVTAALAAVTFLSGCTPSPEKEEYLDCPPARQAWDYCWARFQHPATHLFYDYISSYEPGKALSHLPLSSEVRSQYPNPCGYGTGMEDCAILTGTMMEVLIDRYIVTREDSLRLLAQDLLDGLCRLASHPEAPGFPARGLCTEDGGSYYINSSRDQVTHLVIGLWAYARSPLATREGIERATAILCGVADRMERNVRPENGYDFLRADGEPCPLGICRMWDVQPHEAARLPMIYAAAWDVTGQERYLRLYRRYIRQALDESEQIGEDYSGYVYLQMAGSFHILVQTAEDDDIRARFQALEERLSHLAMTRLTESLQKMRHTDRTALAMTGIDWRQPASWKVQGGYNIPQWGDYREIWNLLREIGESALVVEMTGSQEMAMSCRQMFLDAMEYLDYSHFSSCGIVFHNAAYWRSRLRAQEAP